MYVMDVTAFVHNSGSDRACHFAHKLTTGHLGASMCPFLKGILPRVCVFTLMYVIGGFVLRGMNKCDLIGNLGKDPELKFSQQGIPVATFTLAVNRQFRTRDGLKQQETEWFNVVAWERFAEIANERLRKGSRVYIQGRLKTHRWNRDGHEYSRIEVVVTDLFFIDARGTSTGPYYENDAPLRAADYSSGGQGPDSDDLDYAIDDGDVPF